MIYYYGALNTICEFYAQVRTNYHKQNSIVLVFTFRGVAQLVARQFRVSITTLGVEFSRRAENP